MLVFSLAGAPLSVSHDATRAVNLLYCRSPRSNQMNEYCNLFMLFSIIFICPHNIFKMKSGALSYFLL